MKLFKQAVKTPWGFELRGNFDSPDYNAWVASVVANAANDAAHVKAQNLNKLDTQVSVNDKLSKDERVYLTELQISFLSSWENGKYPIHVDLGFIENLKANLLSQQNNK